MRYFLTILMAVWMAQVASAHPGHLAEVAGHGHWLGAAALGAAIALGAWSALKGKKAAQDDAAEAEDGGEDELEEAAA